MNLSPHRLCRGLSQTSLLSQGCRTVNRSWAHVTPANLRLAMQSPAVGKCAQLRALQTMTNASPEDESAPNHGRGRFIKIVEVGPRDGLQNISGNPVPTQVKLELIKRLLDSGLKVIESGSFVRPDRVPQMADTPSLLQQLPGFEGKQGVHYPVLVPNMRGLDNLIKLDEQHRRQGRSRVTDEIAVFISATDAFSKANNGATVSSLLSSLPAVVDKARQHGYRTRGYVSCVMTDPYSGPTSPEEVIRVARALIEMGCYEISLGDTTGEGDPARWEALWRALERDGVEMERVACHDTFATALPSLLTLLPLGLTTIDTSIAGLGGCPYSPGATGNVATEDVVYMLHKIGYQTGVNLDKLVDVGEWISEVLGRRNESRVGKAVSSRRKKKSVNERKEESGTDGIGAGGLGKTGKTDTEDGA